CGRNFAGVVAKKAAMRCRLRSMASSSSSRQGVSSSARFMPARLCWRAVMLTSSQGLYRIGVRRSDQAIGSETGRAKQFEVDERRMPFANLLRHQLADDRAQLKAVTAEAGGDVKPIDAVNRAKNGLQVRRAVVHAGKAATQRGRVLVGKARVETGGEHFQV